MLGKEATVKGLGVGGRLLAEVAVSVATQIITLILALVLQLHGFHLQKELEKLMRLCKGQIHVHS